MRRSPDHRNTGPPARLTITLLASAAAATAAHAGTEEPAPTAMSEVVVTAQKRAERAVDVPISLSVITGDRARAAGVDSTLDLQRITPGLDIGQNSGEGDFPFISIRGVSMRDFADTNESPSAVYLNGVYKASLTGLDNQTYDIDRVEVLRGPQGALYGRNATGGVINFITEGPTRRPEGYADVLVGDGGRYKVEGAVGGPLADMVSGRLSVLHHAFSGYVHNIRPGSQDGDALNATSVRGQLKAAPTPTLEASLLVEYDRNDNEAGNFFSHRSARQDPVTGLAVAAPGQPDAFGYVDPPGDPRNTDSNEDAYLRTHQLTAIAKVDRRFEGFSLSSVTGFETGAKDAVFDSDSSPNPRSTQVHPRTQELSQELRAQGETGRDTWVLGLYYFNYHVKGEQSRKTSAAVGYRPEVYYDLHTESYAAFADVDHRLTSTLTATGGLRYTHEGKRYDLDNSDVKLVFNPGTVGDRAKRDDDDVSLNGRLSWKPLPSLLVYGGVSQGFKGGTFNVGYTAIPASAIPVRPEKLTDYEAGVKAGLLRGRLDIAGAAFHYDYKDSQAYQFDAVAQSSTTFNRDAVIDGQEVEATLRPMAGLELQASISHLAATLKKVQLTGLTAPGPVVDRKAPLSPDWSSTLEARYSRPAWFGGSFAVQGDLSYKSSQFFDAFNSPFQFEPEYVTADLRASWTDGDRRLTVSVFAENVGDAVYRTYAFDLSFLGQATSVYGRPRRVGAEVACRF